MEEALEAQLDAAPARFTLSALDLGAADAAVASALGAGGLGLVLVEPDAVAAPPLRGPRARALAHARRLLGAEAGDTARTELGSCGLISDVCAAGAVTSSAARDVSAAEAEAAAGDAADDDGGLAHDVLLLAVLLRRVALAVAAACDRALGTQLAAVLRAGSGKARLVRYHARGDGSAAPERARAAGASAGAASLAQRGDDGVWQHWHFDYGLFTCLTGPDVGSVDGSGQSGGGFVCGTGGGLVVLSGAPQPRPLRVSIPADCVAVQVGEAAQILSGGRLTATAHCVLRAGLPPRASRETFVLFQQPAWATRLEGDAGAVLSASAAAQRALEGVVPALGQRWAPGASFAEFAKATTAAYFGRRGLQRPAAQAAAPQRRAAATVADALPRSGAGTPRGAAAPAPVSCCCPPPLPPPFRGPAADSRLGELLLDVLPIACASGFALDLRSARFLCGLTFREGRRRADGSIDRAGFAGATADMIASSLRLQVPWLAEARARPREESEMAGWFGEEPVLRTTMLMRCAASGEERLVRELVAAGAAIASTDGDGRTALHWASTQGHVKVVSALLAADRASATLDAQDRWGRTPLVKAAMNDAVKSGHERVMALLLARGARQELQDKHGYCALHWAARTARAPSVAVLCAAPGADAALTLRNRRGRTPLMCALLAGCEESAAVMRARGAEE